MTDLNTLLDYDLENYQHLKNLKESLYPLLNQGLEILIEHLIKTNEIQQHQERLKQKKIRDRYEQRKIEKEKLREELGSAYESSSDEEEDSFREEYHPEEGDEDRFTPHQGDVRFDQIDPNAPIVEKGEEGEGPNKGTAGSLAPIEEEEDAQESPEKFGDSQSMPDEPAIKPIFNPIEYLAKVLRGLQKGEIPPRVDLKKK